MINKKGEIGNLQGIIFALVTIGLVLGIGFLVLEEMKNQSIDDYTTAIANETLTAVDETGKYVAYNYTTPSIPCFNGVTFSTVTNATGGEVIASGNYTTTTNGWIGSTGGDYNDTDWNVTYSYAHGGEGCTAVGEAIDATATIPTWLSIIIILLIVGILLAIVFKILPTRGGESVGTVAEI